MRTLALAAAAALSLSACHKAADTPAAKPMAGAAPSGDIAGAAKPGLSVSGGALILPAVAGNPGAAYFTLVNDGRSTTAVAALSIAGAQSAEIHQTQGGAMTRVDRLETDPGTRIAFAPGGLHVMVFGVPANLKAGQKIAMTLSFADGDKLTVPLIVRAPGDATGDTH